ncbi:hypothetical protein DAEQUDRAFT_224967 [Daedalea quercina L-15889]|uniref:Grap2 and cyclin-D-interacting-domain-containing protein n=1 Tax=Daedalea quercina L-15889 TaxID=1314783 RepID=A0A165QZI6_9APHY|nr:hypothetical protein DAEQUDRAFT_224967 [Daedalea quercina L-15889]
MADKDNAKVTLQVLVETCSAAADTLKQPTLASAPGPSSSVPALGVLHKDLLSLLTLIYASTTKLTLSLRAEEPAYKAAVGPLQDLIGNVSAIATCAALFDAHGLTLASDVRQVVTEVCSALSALGRTLLEEGEDYLVHTGMVHEVVDKAKRDLSADNRAAVRKRWTADRGMLEDSLQDVASMLEDDDAADQDEDFNDELDDLGLGSVKKMSEVELERTRKVQSLLRFTILLHKRVQLDLLAKPASQPASSATLDSLPAHSQAILVELEDAVATLYAPQDPAAIAAAISSLVNSVKSLQAVVIPMLPSASSTSKTTVGSVASESKGAQTDVRRWFVTCFEQIDKLSHSLGESLEQESLNTT